MIPRSETETPNDDMPNDSASSVVHPAVLPHTITTPATLMEYTSDPNHNYKADDQVQSSNENADQEISNSSHTVNIGNSSLLPQGHHQTSFGDNATTDDPVEVDHQFSQQRQPAGPVLADTPPADFKTEFRVAILLITISSGVLISAALTIFQGNKTFNHTRHEIEFTSLNYMVLLSGICLFLLTQIIRPDIPSLVTIVRFTMWFSLVELTCALGFATYLLLPNRPEVAVPILVVPALVVLIILVMIPSCRCFRRN